MTQGGEAIVEPQPAFDDDNRRVLVVVRYLAPAGPAHTRLIVRFYPAQQTQNSLPSGSAITTWWPENSRSAVAPAAVS
ncbi:hypothetical protein BH24ACT14_BH24ACT14_10960 [soil metagenome]